MHYQFILLLVQPKKPMTSTPGQILLTPPLDDPKPAQVIQLGDAKVVKGCFEVGNKILTVSLLKFKFFCLFLVRLLNQASASVARMAPVVLCQNMDSSSKLQHSEEYEPLVTRVQCLMAALGTTLREAKAYAISLKRQGVIFDFTIEEMQAHLAAQNPAAQKLK